MTSFMFPPASPLGMPHGAATFMGTCSGDGIDCVSGVTVPEGLEGEAVRGHSGCGGVGWRQVV